MFQPTTRAESEIDAISEQDLIPCFVLNYYNDFKIKIVAKSIKTDVY